MSHYYKYDETIEQVAFSFAYQYLNQTLRFTSESGVFSKKRVDFGTHVLLESIKTWNALKVLDIGCGIGIIGLSYAKVHPTSLVHMVDVNKKALELATKNAFDNQIKNVVIYESDVYGAINDSYDAILTNPPIRAGKKVVQAFIEKGKNHLHLGGHMIVVIQKKQGAPSMQSFMKMIFGNVETIAKDKGYYVFKSQKETE